MNKLYTKIAGSDLKFSRFIKVVSLTSIATLLSSVSPVFSQNLVSGGRITTNIKNAGVTYPQSIISVYDDAIGYLGPVNVSNSDYVTVLSTALESKVNASSGYTNFLTSALSDVSDDNLKKAVSTEEKKKQSIISPQLFVRNNLSPQQFNQDGEDSAMMNASDLSQNYLSPEMQRDVSGNNVTFGNNMQVKASNAVVIGSGAKVFRLNTDDNLAWTVVIGANAEVNRGGSVAIGNDTSITKDAVLAIVLGRYTRAEQKGAMGLGYGANGAGEASIAIGYAAQAKMNGSIAIGSTSQLGSLENDINPNDEAHKDLNRTKALGENSIAIGSEAFTNGEKSLAIGSFAKSDKENSVSIGSEAFANGEKSLAIGSLAKSEMDNAVSIGPEASALGEKSIAIGSLAKSEMEDTISIGAESSTLANKSIAFGMKSQATMDLGVAIGAYSLANVGSGVIGYSPFKQGESGNIDYVWRSTLGAVSVGDNSKSQSRQITGVAAGKEDTDAVNIAQLKDLQNYVDKGWKLSVNGNNGKVVGIDGTVDFAAGSSNLNVTKGEEDNKVTFDLAKEITLDKITAGASTLKATGLVITGGPQITTGGIDAGGKKITNVATGTDGADAVNFSQLKELKEQVAASSFVKQEDGTQHITIGKDTGGDKIDIANNENEKRTLTGIKAGALLEDSNEAVIGSQLFTTNQNVTTISNNFQTAATNIAATFGGGAEYKDGTWKAPTFTFKTVDDDGEEKDETYHNVAEALSGVGQSFKNVQNKITNQINNVITKVEGESFIQQDKETNRLTIGKDADGDKIDLINKTGGARTLSGVKAGTDETDAVNFAQLQKVEKDVKEQVAANSFVKQDGTTRNITIGKDTDGNKIDITNNKSEKRILAGIKDGDISKDSNEAVTGSQLFTTNQNVTMVSNNLQTAATNIAATFGGGAEYKDGKWKKPNFRLNAVKEDGTAGEESYTSVAEAFSGVGTSFKNIQNKITNDINNAITKVEDDSFIQQDKKTNRLTIGAKTEGTEVNIANKSGANRIISGVEDAKNNNDAVNKGQFDKGIESVSKDITNKFNDFTQNITHITQQVQGDALSWSESDGAFVAQHGEEKAKSKLKYLLNGDITADSTDAINGSQLYSMSNNLAGYFGSGAGYDEKGEWKAPTFTLKTIKNDGTASEESYNTVEQAFSAVGTSFANIQSKITNEITNEINKTKGDALLWDNENEAFVAQHGQEKANSKITFLANGDISEKSTDAINGSQLYSVIDSLSRYFGGNAGYQNGEWNVPTFYVSQFKNSGNGDEKTSYNNVAGAFEGVNESMKSINERINNVTQSVSSSGLNWNEEEQAFDARHKDQDGKIKHVANGDISEGSKEAVNGSQLWETNNRVSQVENRVDNIDQKVKDIADTVTNDAVKYDKNEKGEKINKVTLAGVSESDPVVLDNVANGHLSKDSKEAVNGSQLWETNQQMKTVLDDARKYTDERFNSILNNQMSDVINEAKSYTDIKFNALNYSIENARKEARQAAAIGLAVSNLRYNETPGKLSVGFGTGLWRNQSAFAFGAGYTSESGSLLSNISVTNSGGHWGIGAGFNMTLN